MTQQSDFFSFLSPDIKIYEMKSHLEVQEKIIAHLQPETALERQLLQEQVFLEGLQWGVPRYGHPEGEIYKHVKEVNDNIDRLTIDAATRTKLRIISFAHDTFKHIEDKRRPRDWSKHHGILARRFMESFLDDELLLNIIELHDEAYYCWRMIKLYQQVEKGQKRLQFLFSKVEGGIQLFYLFFKCDTLTGDKNLAPLKWFESSIAGIELTELSPK